MSSAICRDASFHLREEVTDNRGQAARFAGSVLSECTRGVSTAPLVIFHLASSSSHHHRGVLSSLPAHGECPRVTDRAEMSILAPFSLMWPLAPSITRVWNPPGRALNGARATPPR